MRAFLPMTVLIILIAPIAGKATDRFGSRALMTVGMTLVAAQLLWFSRAEVDSSFWSMLPGLVIGGSGWPAAAELDHEPSPAAAPGTIL